MLWQRGLQSVEAMDAFLSPNLRHLAALELWPEILSSAEFLVQELPKGKVAIWGDYDVDGITATALLVDFLSQKGFPVHSFIPNRKIDGYGLNLTGVERLAHDGIKTLVTVDCGITAVAEVCRAKELGLSVVVTDHHLPGPNLPPCPMANPKLTRCPNPDLAGVGVAFFLAAALNRILPGDKLDMRQFLDLVALGTIADVVSITGQNRILVKNGLLLMNSPKRLGLKYLKEVGGLSPNAKMEAGDVNFVLAPRINAAGRMDDPSLALELLLTSDRDRARTLAGQLDRMNAERKAEENATLEQAILDAQGMQDQAGLVLYKPDWHAGVIGIVASRLVERLYKPCILLTEDIVSPGEKGLLKGSGRSTMEFDLFAGLSGCSDLLSRFGGHRQAAGLALNLDNLDQFRIRFSQAVMDQTGQTLRPTVHMDAQLGFRAITPMLLKEIDLLSPFGPGNPKPLFLSSSLEVQSLRVFGNQHLELRLRDTIDAVTLRGQAWRKAESWQSLPLLGKNVLLAYTPRLSEFNGLISVELTVHSILEFVAPPAHSSA